MLHIPKGVVALNISRTITMLQYHTSAKIIPLNEGNPPSNTIKDTSTIMHINPSLHNSWIRQRVMHDCDSILDSIANGDFLVSMIFRLVHPIPTSNSCAFITVAMYESIECTPLYMCTILYLSQSIEWHARELYSACHCTTHSI